MASTDTKARITSEIFMVISCELPAALIWDGREPFCSYRRQRLRLSHQKLHNSWKNGMHLISVLFFCNSIRSSVQNKEQFQLGLNSRNCFHPTRPFRSWTLLKFVLYERTTSQWTSSQAKEENNRASARKHCLTRKGGVMVSGELDNNCCTAALCQSSHWKHLEERYPKCKTYRLRRYYACDHYKCNIMYFNAFLLNYLRNADVESTRQNYFLPPRKRFDLNQNFHTTEDFQ